MQKDPRLRRAGSPGCLRAAPEQRLESSSPPTAAATEEMGQPAGGSGQLTAPPEQEPERLWGSVAAEGHGGGLLPVGTTDLHGSV